MWPWILLLLFADPYALVRERRYDEAIAAFQSAIAVEPSKASLRKDLAYTLLKVGENEAARDQFGVAMRLEPSDEQAAMEYAFLCYETHQRVEARRIFSRLQNPTARDAFRNIDAPLAEGIARWKEALSHDPNQFSAHEELARLADQRDEFALAAEHYERAWKLKPTERELLLHLGRLWRELGRLEDSNAALLAASRGAQPRVAERARELYPPRYPYVYEFRKALELDPDNLELHRELAYLHLAMGNKQEAETEFRLIVAAIPDDLLSVAQLGFLLLARNDYNAAGPLLDRVLKGDDEELADRVRTALRMPQTLRKRRETPQQKVSREAKDLAARSLAAGYLKDALKYLNIAHESDPVDFAVMLKLGWTYNILKQDNEAIRWFNLARRSPDAAVAGEADRAFHNLQPAMIRFRTTAWFYPFFSSRWHDVFDYSQIKTDMRLATPWIRPYVSLRFVGDTRGTLDSPATGMAPQYLSESAIILGAGIATPSRHGLMAWFEAGESIGYRGLHGGHMLPDFRGGVSFARGWGDRLGAGQHGIFTETNNDAVFVSRFQNDLLLYSQNRTGYTFRATESGFQLQALWSFHLTLDSQRQPWANYVESGPGLRFRVAGLPPSLLFTVSALRGHYLVREGNPRAPDYNDLRAGIWYAFTR